MAAPFGPPPSVATTWILPSGVTRDSVRRSISTRMMEPSGIATGPSGKRSPEAICLKVGVIVVIVSLPMRGTEQSKTAKRWVVVAAGPDHCEQSRSGSRSCHAPEPPVNMEAATTVRSRHHSAPAFSVGLRLALLHQPVRVSRVLKAKLPIQAMRVPREERPQPEVLELRV